MVKIEAAETFHLSVAQNPKNDGSYSSHNSANSLLRSCKCPYNTHEFQTLRAFFITQGFCNHFDVSKPQAEITFITVIISYLTLYICLHRLCSTPSDK